MVGEPVLPSESRDGFRTLNPVAVLQVRDSLGNVLKKYEAPQSDRIFSAEVAYIMSDIMSDDVARAPAFGANTALTLPDRKVAAKTGTTNGWKDNWTMGYTPQVTVGVWVGNTDNESMENTTGLDGAAPIWNAVMRYYLQNENAPAIWYERPPGVTSRTICVPSGLLPSETCPGSSQRAEIFVAGSEPTLTDNIWQAFEIDTETGFLASPLTPPERKETRVYQILPQEAADWVAESGIAQPPPQQSVVNLEDFDPDAAIISPTLNSYIAGVVEVQGNARGGPFRLEYGRGLEPSEWIAIGNERGDEVVNGVLERFDTSGIEEGLYTLRLTVNRGDGPRVWTTPITIDNTPPTAVISDPRADRLYVMETDEQINVNVIANDTWAVDRVEFSINGVVFASSTVAPWNERWKITMRDIANVEAANTQNFTGFPSDDPDVQPGRMLTYGDGFIAIRTAQGVYFESHELRVRVFDRAGNSSQSEPVRIYVRHEPEDE
jgi:hypothetical protein